MCRQDLFLFFVVYFFICMTQCGTHALSEHGVAPFVSVLLKVFVVKVTEQRLRIIFQDIFLLLTAG